MEILLNGLGPNDTVSYDNMLYRNGDTIVMEDGAAQAFLNAKLAVPAQPGEVLALQNLETNNVARRENVRDRAQANKEDI